MKNKMKDSQNKVKEEIKGYAIGFLSVGTVFLLFSLWIIYSIFIDLPFFIFFISLSIGCIISIYLFFHFSPYTPYILGSNLNQRVLEPYELNIEQRRAISYINSKHGQRIQIETIVAIYFFVAIVKIVTHVIKNQKPDYSINSFNDFLSLLIPLFFLWASLGVFSFGRVLFITYKNWEFIQMTVEPWPLDKPLSKKKKLLSLEDYRKRLIKLSEDNDFIREFLETHSFETLSLFLSDNRFSAENLKKISELENPTEYFEFLEKVSYEDDKFQKFSIGNLINGFHSRLEEDPEAYYDSYERLFMKAKGDLLEVMGKESFNDFILENVEFFLERMEKDPEWEAKAEKIFSMMSRYELQELKKSLPDTSFGMEMRECIEKFLEKRPIKRKKLKRKSLS